MNRDNLTTPSLRRRMFHLLYTKGPLSYAQFFTFLNMSPKNGGVAIILRGEVPAGRIEVQDGSGERGSKVYALTEIGERHYEEDKVDDWAHRNKLGPVGRRKRIFKLLERE